MTHEWWNGHRGRYDIYISQAVIAECSNGDPEAAQERLRLLVEVPHLDLSKAVRKLARRLFLRTSLPEKAKVDALHIAVSAVHGIEYLLTWNCAHMANAELRDRINAACLSAGCAAPKICTPQELMGE
jgi:predicted nucleic acid-binding protein